MIKRQKLLWMVLAMLMPQVFKASTVTIADIQSLTLSDGTGFSNFSAFQSAFNGASQGSTFTATVVVSQHLIRLRPVEEYNSECTMNVTGPNSFNVTLQAQTSNAITGINYSSKAGGSQSLSPVPSSITFIVGTGGGGGPTGAPTGSPTGAPTGPTGAPTVTIADIQSLTLSDGTGFSNFSAFQSAFNGASQGSTFTATVVVSQHLIRLRPVKEYNSECTMNVTGPNSFNVTLQAQTSNAITGINYSSKASGSQSLSPVPSSITFIVGTGGGGGPTGAPTGAPTGSPTGSPTQQQGDLNHSINLGTQEQFTSLTLYGTKGEKASANAKQLIELNQALQFLQLNPQNAQQVGGTDMNILLWYTDLKTTVASALLQSSSGPSKNINDNIRLQGIISSIGYTTNLNPNPTYVYMPQMTAAGSGLLTANITYISTGASVPNVATVSLASGDTFASVTLYSYGQTPVAMSAANLVALNALVKSSSKTVAIWDSNSNSGAFIPNNGSSSSGTNTSIRGPICAIGYTTVKGDSGIQYVTIAGTMQMATVQVYTLSGIITSLYLETQNFANGKYSNSILDRFWSGHGYGILLPSGNNNYKAWIRFTEALNIGHTITATLTNNSMTFIDTTTNKPIAICNPSTINPQHSSGPDASPVVAIGISTVDSSYQSFSIQEGQTLTLVNVNGNLTVTIQ